MGCFSLADGAGRGFYAYDVELTTPVMQQVAAAQQQMMIMCRRMIAGEKEKAMAAAAVKEAPNAQAKQAAKAILNQLQSSHP